MGKGAGRQPLLTLVAVLVDVEKVQPLSEAVRRVALDHLGGLPADFELHGTEVWGGGGHWKGKAPNELLAVYEQAIDVLVELEIDVSYASIHKQRLHDRYNGGADDNAYLLALQFLLEKIDSYYPAHKILIADEAKEQQLRAVRMVADLQDWGGGQVPGRRLRTVVDGMHFVSSTASPGVQLADIVAFALQRKWNGCDSHPNAVAGLQRICSHILDRTRTWREEWPARTFP